MDAITTDFGEVLLWSFWFFIWIAALMVWFRCLFDLFGDSSLSGWGKAGWALLLIFVPWLGALIYLIARGRSMTERQVAAAADLDAQQRDVHPAGCRHVPGPGGRDRPRQGAARFRGHQPGGVRGAEVQGSRLGTAKPGASLAGAMPVRSSNGSLTGIVAVLAPGDSRALSQRCDPCPMPGRTPIR